MLTFFAQQLIDEQGTLKESAAEALSALALSQPQTSSAPAGGPSGLPFPLQKQQAPIHSQQALTLLSLAEPGPSSHPNGPPNLGQLSALAAAAGASAAPENQSRPPEGGKSAGAVEPPKAESASPVPTPTRTRGARSANMGSDEWARQRKDNHVRPSISLLV
jgi:transcriptional regulator CBF1